MRLRYPSACRDCGAELEAGTTAVYDRSTKTVQCLACRDGAGVNPYRAASRGDLVAAGFPRRVRTQEREHHVMDLAEHRRLTANQRTVAQPLATSRPRIGTSTGSGRCGRHAVRSTSGLSKGAPALSGSVGDRLVVAPSPRQRLPDNPYD